MKFREIIGLFVAIILAIAVAFLVRYFLAEKEGKKGSQVTQESKMMKILVASKPLDVGTKVQSGDLVWQSWPSRALNDSYIQEGTVQLQNLTGSIILERLDKGEPVITTNLVQPGDKSVLAALLSPGKRAISIDVTAQSVSSGLIQPGDYVDVLVSKVVSPSGGNSYGQTTAVVSNIKVLALDKVMNETDQKLPTTTIPKVATLEVAPGQAELITAAVKEGNLSLSLHSLSNNKMATDEETLTGLVTVIRGKEVTQVQVN